MCVLTDFSLLAFVAAEILAPRTKVCARPLSPLACPFMPAPSGESGMHLHDDVWAACRGCVSQTIGEDHNV